jgi:sortase B
MAMFNETANLTERDGSNFFLRFVKYFIPWKGDKSNEIIRKIAFCGSIALFAMSLNKLSDYLGASREEQKSYIQDVVIQYEPKFDGNVSYDVNAGGDDYDAANPEAAGSKLKLQDWAKPLLKRNEDVIGWIKIPGFTDYSGEEYINFPVLRGKDNNEYLYKNLDRDYYESGSIFIDAESIMDENGQTDNITVFGHHMGYVGTSFTHLSEYEQGVDFLKKYPVIEFNSIYESGRRYAIISCFAINIHEEDDGGDVWEYVGWRDFNDDDRKFEDWYDQVSKRSWYSSNIKCTENDKYITLSTCSKLLKDLRWVIVAKKLTPDDNIDQIVKSYKAKPDKDIYFPKYWRDLYGNNKVYKGWEY